MIVFVLGDIMLDEYVYVTPTKLSQEAPIAVGRYNKTIYVPGGAANAAANCAALGAHSFLAGYIGKDNSAETIKALMGHHLIKDCVVEAPSWDTIRKVRIVDESGHQFVRVDYENPEPFIHLDSRAMLHQYIQTAKLTANSLLLSDYGKGTLQGVTMQAISSFRENKKFVVVNGKPQNISQYREANVVTMNKAEWEQVFKNNYPEPLPIHPGEIMKRMAKGFYDATLIMTCGSDPVVVYSHGDTYYYEASKVEVADVSGAGDTFAAVIAVLGNSDPDTIVAAVSAAGEVVSCKGTAVPKRRIL
jgi:D-beta-D-heptose 7-phosphate kinase/D-beta-D-heptose 1-phosphate adenosyltransferase